MSDPRHMTAQLWEKHQGMWRKEGGWRCSCDAQLICDPNSWTDAGHALDRHLWAVLLEALLAEFAPTAKPKED